MERDLILFCLLIVCITANAVFLLIEHELTRKELRKIRDVVAEIKKRMH